MLLKINIVLLTESESEFCSKSIKLNVFLTGLTEFFFQLQVQRQGKQCKTNKV